MAGNISISERARGVFLWEEQRDELKVVKYKRTIENRLSPHLYRIRGLPQNKPL